MDFVSSITLAKITNNNNVIVNLDNHILVNTLKALFGGLFKKGMHSELTYMLSKIMSQLQSNLENKEAYDIVLSELLFARYSDYDLSVETVRWFCDTFPNAGHIPTDIVLCLAASALRRDVALFFQALDHYKKYERDVIAYLPMSLYLQPFGRPDETSETLLLLIHRYKCVRRLHLYPIIGKLLQQHKKPTLVVQNVLRMENRGRRKIEFHLEIAKHANYNILQYLSYVFPTSIPRYHDDVNDPLCEAASHGNIDYLRHVVNDACKHDNGKKVSRQLLDIALRNGHFECAHYILDNYSQCLRKGERWMVYEISLDQGDCIEMTKTMLENIDKVACSLRIHILNANRLDVIQLLLASKPSNQDLNLNLGPTLRAAIIHQHMDIIDLIVSHNPQCSINLNVEELSCLSVDNQRRLLSLKVLKLQVGVSIDHLRAARINSTLNNTIKLLVEHGHQSAKLLRSLGRI
ncbi:hypothetical protein SAMD00019534_014890 [Acytostelium subglobosum LB1]|uniref:hypothetical protein n=1 Tax=Acytostelium subglobosum LB1 TaxID=1410327 RepID=UPI000644D77D|nr:hypothetical protein SAMD00019534_014890 [Acytostelium subglobosum LB1]GAM18314.1 hypothetical protein SAMD00019534_014890 [Acytostelium subglobosum LB1]|eukprot:XP_012757534.1 hypothetical protein SAMD00019534_014890 [Acytostelium subglobosum LB1]